VQRFLTRRKQLTRKNSTIRFEKIVRAIVLIRGPVGITKRLSARTRTRDLDCQRQYLATRDTSHLLGLFFFHFPVPFPF
jgi:hypothetical protein